MRAFIFRYQSRTTAIDTTGTATVTRQFRLAAKSIEIERRGLFGILHVLQPMQRYLILNGDKTTANGTVVAAPTTIQFMGRDIAHEGDDVQCPACHTTGKIRCDGPRQVMTAPDGRHAALSDDLCICKCEPAPKLVASQQLMSVDA
jgi:uncharacterized Zn-binding protein involved in type VI secretion